MSEKKLYLHLGLPKCASTSLQSLFYNSDKISYGGFCPEPQQNGLFWKNKESAWLFDYNLRFFCSEEERSKKVIEDFLGFATKKVCLLSSENISLRFLPWDLPTETKLTFLKKILPKTKLFFVYRNPLKTLVSLYKEQVLMGYSKSYEQFIEEQLLYKDLSYLSDILLNKTIQRIESVFDKESMRVFFLEDPELTNKISTYLGTPLATTNDRKNTSITDHQATSIAQKNRYSSRSWFDCIENHRALPNTERQEVKFSLARRRKKLKEGTDRFSFKKAKSHYLKNTAVKRLIENDLTKALETPSMKAHQPFIREYLDEIRNETSTHSL